MEIFPASIRKVNYIDILFGIILILVLILSSIWHEGIRFCDSATYVIAAKDFIETHSVNYGDLFSTRIIAWLPYALYIALFGVNDSISWVGTIEFCILLCLIYFAFRKYDREIAFYAVVLLAFSTFMMRESSAPMGDVMLTLLVNIPLLMYWRAVLSNDAVTGSLKWRGIAAGFFWVLAFYTKESAVFFLPLFFFLSFRSVLKKQKQENRFWMGFWMMLAIMAVASAGYFWFQTGDPFQKLKMASENIDGHSLISSQRMWQSYSELLYRLTFQPAVFFVYEYTFGIFGILALLFLVHKEKNENAVFWKWCIVILALTWWVVPQRLNPYTPIWLTHRLWLPLLVPLAIGAAHGIKILAASRESKTDRLMIAVSAAALIIVAQIFLGDEPEIGFRRVCFYAIAGGFIIISVFTDTRNNDIFPELRKLVFIVLLIPFFYTHSDRYNWDDSKSEFAVAGDVLALIGEKDDSIQKAVFGTTCFAQLAGLHDVKDFSFLSYQNVPVQDTGRAYLVLESSWIELKYSDKNSGRSDFMEIDNMHYAIETNPEKFGFVKIGEVEKFMIYFRE